MLGTVRGNQELISTYAVGREWEARQRHSVGRSEEVWRGSGKGGIDRPMEGDGEDARVVNRKWGCGEGRRCGAIRGNSGKSRLAGATKFGARGTGRREVEGEVWRDVGIDGKLELGRG